MNATRRAFAITNEEFADMLRMCFPPIRSRRTIGVANSGGPDSTCLLFLLNRYLSTIDIDNPRTPSPFSRLVSITVNHDLQSSSSAMADQCAKISKILGVEHMTAKIHWGEAPFPQRPLPGNKFEHVARNARYHALFECMKVLDTNILAFGHHGDDQVETSLMRISKGSTILGTSGMRRCRRWGMGMGKTEKDLGWVGQEGVDRWIVRPLLALGKDRILATCEENGLDYVTDATNFQPHVTLRNAVRHMLHNGQSPHQDGERNLPKDIAEELETIKKASFSVLSVGENSSLGQLRTAVNNISSHIEDVEHQADKILDRCRLPSPPSTFLLSSRALNDIKNELIRHVLILRVLRYVSPFPWGSNHAEASRNSSSINQIIKKVWHPTPFQTQIRPFVAGAGVEWTPVVVRRGDIKFLGIQNSRTMEDRETIGWLASRQPPFSLKTILHTDSLDSLQHDVTEALAQGLMKWRCGNGPLALDVLYDCRFVIRFDFSRIPEDTAAAILAPSTHEKIVIKPSTRWFCPIVVHRRRDSETVTHSKLEQRVFDQNEKLEDLYQYWTHRQTGISVDWITMTWIRPLHAS